MNNIIYIKGRKIDQRQLREFLDGIDLDDFHEEDKDGIMAWKSPITGELFRTKMQLFGHIGAYLRTPNRKDVTEPTRRGYMRALRAGLTPSDEQKDAHRRYVKALRDKHKNAASIDGVHARIEKVKATPTMSERKDVREEKRQKMFADRRARVNAAFAAEESGQVLP